MFFFIFLIEMSIVRGKLTLHLSLVQPDGLALDATAQLTADDFSAKYEDKRTHARHAGAIGGVVGDEVANFHLQSRLFVDLAPRRLRWMLAPAHKTAGEGIVFALLDEQKTTLVLDNHAHTAKGGKVSKKQSIEQVKKYAGALVQEAIEETFQHRSQPTNLFILFCCS